MTRQECEQMIAGAFKTIVDIYHIYNPDGNYLSLTYLNNGKDSINWFFNNSRCDDIDRYISCHGLFEKEA